METPWWLWLWNWLADPTLAYILLVGTFWFLLAALAIPGTGLPEGLAVIGLVLAMLALARLPVSIVGLLLLIGSWGLLLNNLRRRTIGFTVGGALAMLLGSFFLFNREAGPASYWVILGMTAATVGLFTVAQRAQQLPAQLDINRLVGMVGKATTPLEPEGTVRIAAELWSAVSTAPVPVGGPVRVVRVQGLTLYVEPYPTEMSVVG